MSTPLLIVLAAAGTRAGARAHEAAHTRPAGSARTASSATAARLTSDFSRSIDALGAREAGRTTRCACAASQAVGAKAASGS